MSLLLADVEGLGHNFYSRFRSNHLAALLLDLLSIILGADYVVFALLVGLVFLRDHRTVGYVLLSGLRDHDQQLKRVSLRTTLGNSQPSWEAVDVVGLREETFDV